MQLDQDHEQRRFALDLNISDKTHGEVYNLWHPLELVPFDIDKDCIHRICKRNSNC